MFVGVGLDLDVPCELAGPQPFVPVLPHGGCLARAYQGQRYGAQEGTFSGAVVTDDHIPACTCLWYLPGEIIDGSDVGEPDALQVHGAILRWLLVAQVPPTLHERRPAG